MADIPAFVAEVLLPLTTLWTPSRIRPVGMCFIEGAKKIRVDQNEIIANCTYHRGKSIANPSLGVAPRHTIPAELLMKL